MSMLYLYPSMSRQALLLTNNRWARCMASTPPRPKVRGRRIFMCKCASAAKTRRTILPTLLTAAWKPPISNGRNRSRAPTHHSIQLDSLPKHHSRIHPTKRHKPILPHRANFSRTRIRLCGTTKGRRRQVAQEVQRFDSARTKDGYSRSKAREEETP
jgi:hypothetical protein